MPLRRPHHGRPHLRPGPRAALGLLPAAGRAARTALATGATPAPEIGDRLGARSRSSRRTGLRPTCLLGPPRLRRGAGADGRGREHLYEVERRVRYGDGRVRITELRIADPERPLARAHPRAGDVLRRRGPRAPLPARSRRGGGPRCRARRSRSPPAGRTGVTNAGEDRGHVPGHPARGIRRHTAPLVMSGLRPAIRVVAFGLACARA